MPAVIVLDARPQKPPILDFRTGRGGLAADVGDTALSDVVLSVPPDKTLATKLPTPLSREVARFGAGA
jgi:hypothetical protein